jgi:hypothetical protein
MKCCNTNCENQAIKRGKFCSNACKQVAYRNRKNGVTQRPLLNFYKDPNEDTLHMVKRNATRNRKRDKIPVHVTQNVTSTPVYELLSTYKYCCKSFNVFKSNAPSFDCFLVLHKICETNTGKRYFPLMDYVRVWERYNNDEEMIMKYIKPTIK